MIKREEVERLIEASLPSAQMQETFRNPQYQSWCLEVVTDELHFEYSWGPLSGFGFTDLQAEIGENYNPFDPYDVSLDSLEDAQRCLLNLLAS